MDIEPEEKIDAMELESFTPDKSGTEYPVWTINHKKSVFTDGTNEFIKAPIVLLGVFEQRIGWPMEKFGDDNKPRMIPVCKSPNNIIGYRTQYGAQVTNLPEIGRCATCVFRDWRDRKQPCGKVFILPFIHVHDMNAWHTESEWRSSVHVLRLNRSAKKPVGEVFAKMGKVNPPYVYSTVLELRGQENDGNRYSVPSFGTLGKHGIVANTATMSSVFKELFTQVRDEFEAAALPAPPRSGTLSPMSMGD